MSIKFTNTSELQNKLEKRILSLLESKLPVLAKFADDSKNKAYNGAFSKDPVDTAESKNRTTIDLIVSQRPAGINIIYEIKPEKSRARKWKNGSVEDYAIFFIAPLQARNPNFKYGERNTLKFARDDTARKIGIKIK